MNEPKSALTEDSARVTETAEKGKSQNNQQKDIMNKLTKSLSILTLSLTAAISKLKAAAIKESERSAKIFRDLRFNSALN